MMVEQTHQSHQYRLGYPDVDPFDENTADHRVANNALRVQARPGAYPDPSVPLFLSDPDGEPDPRAYLAPRKRRTLISSRILAAVMAAAAVAVLFALLTSGPQPHHIMDHHAPISANFA